MQSGTKVKKCLLSSSFHQIPHQIYSDAIIYYQTKLRAKHGGKKNPSFPSVRFYEEWDKGKNFRELPTGTSYPLICLPSASFTNFFYPSLTFRLRAIVTSRLKAKSNLNAKRDFCV